MMPARRLYSGNVLLLGNGSRAFLTAIRSLGRIGLKVDVGMCPPDDLALQSRYVSSHLDIPPYSAGSTEWLGRMKAILAEKSYNLVVPCNDPSLIPLQQHRNELQQLCRLYTLNDHAYQISFDKIASSNLAVAEGIPVPRGVVVSGPDAAAQVLDTFTLPVVLKPLSSFAIGDLRKKRTVKRARTASEVKAYFLTLKEHEPTLVQENFVGIGVGVELLAQNGEVLVAFQHQRVHEPLEGGGSSYRKSVPLREDLLLSAKKLMRALQYTGVAMVEFKLNSRTGKWIFVEINGRFWGSLPLAVASGMDFPRYLYEMLVENRKTFPNHYQTGIYCRNTSKDVRWMIDNLSADKNDPTLASLPLHLVVGELQNVVLLRERNDTFVLDDPGPGIAEINKIMRDAFLSAKRKIFHQFLGSRLGKRLTRAAIQERLRQAKSILFVCKGNICRSPFAHWYAAKTSIRGIVFSSCGYYPVSNRPATENAQRAAKNFDVDLTSHQSQVVTDEMLLRADIVFVFDSHNHQHLSTQFPQIRRRIHYLGSLLQDGPLFIEDPYGSSEEVFARTYQQIVMAIEELFTLA